MKTIATTITIILLAATIACGGERDEVKQILDEFQSNYGVNLREVAKDNQQYNQNLADFLSFANRYPSPWIRLIEQYDLYDYLEISDAQRLQLEGVDSPVASTVADYVAGGRADARLRQPKAVFWRWVREKWSPEMHRFLRLSNEAVEEILKPKQLKRLRQLSFQHHAILHAAPRAAYASHDIKLTDKKVGELTAGFGLAKQQAFSVREALAFHEACDILAEQIGQEKFDRAAGKRVFFGHLDQTLASELFPSQKKAPPTINRRREFR